MLVIVTCQLCGQVVICDDKNSYHPVDMRIVQFKDSLQKENVDTVLIYRHWESVGSFNGYGKIFWIDKGVHFECKISMSDWASNGAVATSKVLASESDALLNFYFDNNLKSITEHPKQTMINFYQDASHFVELIHLDDEYCFLIDGLDVRYGDKNLRAEWIKLLADKEVCSVRID